MLPEASPDAAASVSSTGCKVCVREAFVIVADVKRCERVYLSSYTSILGDICPWVGVSLEHLLLSWYPSQYQQGLYMGPSARGEAHDLCSQLSE